MSTDLLKLHAPRLLIALQLFALAPLLGASLYSKPPHDEKPIAKVAYAYDPISGFLASIRLETTDDFRSIDATDSDRHTFRPFDDVSVGTLHPSSAGPADMPRPPADVPVSAASLSVLVDLLLRPLFHLVRTYGSGQVARTPMFQQDFSLTYTGKQGNCGFLYSKQIGFLALRRLVGFSKSET